MAYTDLVSALKTLTIPVAEDGWTSRPEVNTYAVVQLDFEADAFDGDDQKMDRSFSGSGDLFSYSKNGEGFVSEIEAKLAEYCGPSWGLNSHVWEQGTRRFHWEWEFEVDG